MRKGGPIDDDVNKFIMDLELSAKRILKDANKKDLDNRAAMVDTTHKSLGKRTKEFRADHNALPSLKSFTKTGSVLVTTGKHQSNSTAALLTSSSDNLFPLKESATTQSVPPDMETTRLMKYSIPKMTVSMSADRGKLDQMTRKYNDPAQLTAASADDALSKDPLFAPYKQTPPAVLQSMWNLHSDATNVLSGKTDGHDPAKVLQVKLPTKASRRRLELQGPVDWASKGLRVKYRAETEREEAWNVWRTVLAYSNESFERRGDVIPITTISRHPLYVSYEAMLEAENSHSNDRTKSRLKMKRFVLDVYEVWLTNLPHLAEHQPSYVLQQTARKGTGGANQRDQLPPYTVGDSHSLGGDQLSSQLTATNNTARSTFGGVGASIVSGASSHAHADTSRRLTEDDLIGNNTLSVMDIGLSNRRDTGALLALEAQIQSVSQRRSLKLGFYTDSNMYNFFPIDFDPARDREQYYDGERLQLVKIANALGVSNTIRTQLVSNVPRSMSHSTPVQVIPRLQLLIDRTQVDVPVQSFDGQITLDEIPPHRVLVSLHRILRPEIVPPADCEDEQSFSMQQLYPLSTWRLTAYNCETMAESCLFFEETSVLLLMQECGAPKPEPPVDHSNHTRDDNHEYDNPEDNSGTPNDEEKESFDDTSSFLNTWSAVYYAKQLMGHVQVHVNLTVPTVPTALASASPPAPSATSSSSAGIDSSTPVGDDENPPDLHLHTEQLWAAKRSVQMTLRLPRLNTTLTHTTTTALRCLLHPRDGEGKQVNPDELYVPDVAHAQAVEGVGGLADLRMTWEDLLHYASPSMAMQVSGAYRMLMNVHVDRPSYETEHVPVPGACAVGRVGLWGFTNSPFPVVLALFDQSEREKAIHAVRNCAVLDEKGDELTVNVKATDRHKLRRCGGDFSRVSAMFTRLHNTIENPSGAFENPRYMRFKTVLSTAIEATEIFTSAIYWEDPAFHAVPESKRGPQPGQGPDKWPLEYILNPHPVQTAAHPAILLATKLTNAIETRLSLLASNFNVSPTALVDAPGHGHVRSTYSSKNNLDASGRGFKGFRARVETSTIDADPDLPTFVYGITNAAAVPNTTGVNTRNVWHATQTITEKINRPRVVAEYLYIIQTQTSSGINEPDLFHVCMRGGEFMKLVSLMRCRFEEEYSETQILREQFTRRMALEGKIEQGDVILKARKKDTKQALRRELQFEIEKKQRKSYKSERGWKKRYDLSALIDTQGDWERRRDEKSSLIFFHKKLRQRKLRAQLQATRGGSLDDESSMEIGGSVEQFDSMDSFSPQRVKKMRKGEVARTYADPDSTFAAYKEQQQVIQEKGGQSLLKGMGLLDDDTIQWEGNVAVEKYAETCQWEVPGEWVGDPLLDPEVVVDPRDMGGSGGMDGTSREGEGVGLTWQDLSADGARTASRQGTAGMRRGGSAPGLASMPAEYSEDMDADAFEEPLESWAPTAEESSGMGFVSVRHMRTPGTAPKGDRRWNTPGALVGPGMGLGQPPSSAMSSTSRLGGSRRGSAGAVDLKMIAEKLVNNEELMSLLARKLGLPEPKKPIYKGPVPANPRGGYGGMDAYDEDDENPREDEIGDDLWSDGEDLDDGEGVEGENEAMQMVFAEEAAAQGGMAVGGGRGGLAKKRKGRGGSNRRKVETPALGSNKASGVTFLNIAEAVHGARDPNRASSPVMGAFPAADAGSDGSEGESQDESDREAGNPRAVDLEHIRGLGWRKLPRPEVVANFHNRCVQSQTMSSAVMLGAMTRAPDAATLKELNANAPTYLAPIAPVDAINYKGMEFTIEVGAIFIANAKGDLERAMGQLERNVQREQEFAKGIPTEDLLLQKAEELENTTVDKALQRQFVEDQEAENPVPLPPGVAGKKPATGSAAVMLAVDRAINAAKSDNVVTMEDALEENVPIDVTDQYGNSLLILAAQQGSKRMIKFLLRRGANINFQNVQGNTCLHYTVAYEKPDLTKYMVSKGANDSILNQSGLTCYEGISFKKVTHL